MKEGNSAFVDHSWNAYPNQWETLWSKYIRLSQEDGDLGDDKTVSCSILHQRDLIQNYIKNNPELAKCPQQEFFDDGYTGRDFGRPAFERLLEKIRAGEINCVIVKDCCAIMGLNQKDLENQGILA